jgi:O-acetylhomoserine/O-acetylserine sulfhydrylase
VASGSAAIAMTIMALAGAGDNFVSSFHVHAGTFHQFGSLAKQMGIECRFVKSRDPADFAAVIDEKTKFVWVETISNPGNVILDLEAISTVCHANGIPLIVSINNNTVRLRGVGAKTRRMGFPSRIVVR